MRRATPLAAFALTGCIGISAPPITSVDPGVVRGDLLAAGGPARHVGESRDEIGGVGAIAFAASGPADSFFDVVAGGASLTVAGGKYWEEVSDAGFAIGNTSYLRFGFLGPHTYLGAQVDFGLVPTHLGASILPALRFGPLQIWALGGSTLFAVPRIAIFGGESSTEIVPYLRWGGGLAVDFTEGFGVFAAADVLHRPWLDFPTPDDNDVADTYQATAGVRIRVMQRNFTR